MRMMRIGFPVLLLARAAGAQEVAECGAAPAATELVEPWEETGAVLGAGAIRLALLHGAREEGMRLLVLTLPPPEGTAPADGAPVAPERTCRIVTEGGLGFADLDIGGLEVAEDPEAATLTARVPALHFIPESTELEERTLVLTFGVRDDSLSAELELPEAAPEAKAEAVPESEAAPEPDAASEPEAAPEVEEEPEAEEAPEPAP